MCDVAGIFDQGYMTVIINMYIHICIHTYSCMSV